MPLIIITNRTNQNRVISQPRLPNGRLPETTIPALGSAEIDICRGPDDKTDADAMTRFFEHIAIPLPNSGDDDIGDAALTWELAPAPEPLMKGAP